MSFPVNPQALPAGVLKDVFSPGNMRGRAAGNSPTMSFPKSRSSLWDGRAAGELLHLHLCFYRKPRVLLLEKTLRLAQRHARRSNKSQLHCFFLGSVSVDADEEGVTVTLDRFDPGRNQAGASDRVPSALLPGDVVVPCLFCTQMGSDAVVQSEEELLQHFKMLQQYVSSRQALDLSQLLKVKGHVLCWQQTDAAVCSLSWSAVCPSVTINVQPVRPIPIIPTALLRSLTDTGQQHVFARQRGFVTMDQTRKLLLLLEFDPKASKLPLVGLWISGVIHAYNPQVWAWCLRFLFSSALQDRVFSENGCFLLVVFGLTHSAPQFFQCQGPGPSQLDFQLYSASQSVTLYQVVPADSQTLECHLTSEHHGSQMQAFREAQNSFSSAAGLSITDQDSGVEDEDLSPRPSPSPHLLAQQTNRVQPSVPELSLLIDGSFTSSPAWQDATSTHRPPPPPTSDPSERNAAPCSPATSTTPPHRLHSTPNSNLQQPCTCCSSHAYNCTSIFSSELHPAAAPPAPSHHITPPPPSSLHLPPPPSHHLTRPPHAPLLRHTLLPPAPSHHLTPPPHAPSLCHTPPPAPSHHFTPPPLPPSHHLTPPPPAPSHHLTPPPLPPLHYLTPPHAPSHHLTPPPPPSQHLTPPPHAPSLCHTPPSAPSHHLTPPPHAPSQHLTPPPPPSQHLTPPPHAPSLCHTPPSAPSHHLTPPSSLHSAPPPVPLQSTSQTPPFSHVHPPAAPPPLCNPSSPPSNHPYTPPGSAPTSSDPCPAPMQQCRDSVCPPKPAEVIPPNAYHLLQHHDQQLRLLQAQVHMLLEAQRKLQTSGQQTDTQTSGQQTDTQASGQQTDTQASGQQTDTQASRKTTTSVAVGTGAGLFWEDPVQPLPQQELHVTLPSSPNPSSPPPPSSRDLSAHRPVSGAGDGDITGQEAPGSPSSQHSADGWQSPVLGESASMFQPADEQQSLYQNLMTQLTSRLQESDNKQEMEDSMRRWSLPGLPHSSRTKRRGGKQEAVVGATLRRLQQLGVTVNKEDVLECDRQLHQTVESSSTLALINPAAVLSRLSMSEPTGSCLLPGGSVDLSLEANAIDLRYLSDSQLSRLSLGGRVPPPAPTSSTGSLLSPSNMSVATRKYMRSYGLIEEENDEDEEEGDQDTPSRQPLCDAQNLLPQSQLIRDLRPKLQRLTDGSKTHKDKENCSGRRPSSLRASNQQPEGSVGNILDLSRLRQLPKLF